MSSAKVVFLVSPNDVLRRVVYNIMYNSIKSKKLKHPRIPRNLSIT